MMIEILLVAVLSLAFRALNLLSMPIYGDEANYLGWALDMWDRKTLAALMHPVVVDGKQPLFMILAGGASYLFPDPLLAGRAVSVLAGVLSAVGVYLVGRWLMGRRVGLVAGLLYAVVPFNLFYDRLALIDALLNAEAVWVLALSVLISSRTRGTRSAVLAGTGLGIVLGMALWTKMSALFTLSFPLLCALFLLRRCNLKTTLSGFAVAGTVATAAAALLFLAPEAGYLWDRTGYYYVEPPGIFLATLSDRLVSNTVLYWSWVHGYLPTPIWVLVPLATIWGLVRRTRQTVLLIGCWAAATMPIILLSRGDGYPSRYVLEGVFPLLLLLAALIEAIWDELVANSWFRRMPFPARGAALRLVASLLLAGLLVAPSLWFDVQVISAPDTAPLPGRDRVDFVTSYLSGYGFNDAMHLLRRRAMELTADGQPVIVLSNYYWGDVYGGLKMYLRGVPGVVTYFDSHLTWDPERFIAAWRPHNVPILVLGNDGIDRLDQFEQAVPQAKRLGFFPKPTGRSSFRVYEVDVADLNP